MKKKLLFGSAAIRTIEKNSLVSNSLFPRVQSWFEHLCAISILHISFGIRSKVYKNSFPWICTTSISSYGNFFPRPTQHTHTHTRKWNGEKIGALFSLSNLIRECIRWCVYVLLCFVLRVFRRRERLKYVRLCADCWSWDSSRQQLLPHLILRSATWKESTCAAICWFLLCAFIVWCIVIMSFSTVTNSSKAKRARVRKHTLWNLENLESWEFCEICPRALSPFQLAVLYRVWFIATHTYTNAQQLNTEKWKWKLKKNRNHRALCNFLWYISIHIQNVGKTKKSTPTYFRYKMIAFWSSFQVKKKIISSASWLTGNNNEQKICCSIPKLHVRPPRKSCRYVVCFACDTKKER